MEKCTESVEHGGGKKDGEGPSLGGAPRKGDDQLLVELLALGSTHHQAGSELGISARTVARRRREPDIARAIRERRGDVVSEVAGQLTGLARQAMTVLADELESDDARIRMGASKAVLDRVTRFCAATMTQEAFERQEDEELQARPVAPDSWPGWDLATVPTRAPASIGPWDAAYAAIEERRWTWADVRGLSDQEAIDEVRAAIGAAAVALRTERERAFQPCVDCAFNAAVLIVSYTPGEDLPTAVGNDGTRRPLWSYIDDGTMVLNGAKQSTPAFAIGIVAAGVKLALGTRDGIELRRRIWANPAVAAGEEVEPESPELDTT